MASGQIFFALILTVAKVTTLELIAKQKSPTILQLKPFSPHFFHDCILTPKRRSIFKQPRYIPGTTHINFSHAFRISALSNLLKKQVLKFLQQWSVYRRTLLQTTYNAITKFGLISDKKLSRKHKLKIFKKIETGKCSKKKTKM